MGAEFSAEGPQEFAENICKLSNSSNEKLNAVQESNKEIVKDYLEENEKLVKVNLKTMTDNIEQLTEEQKSSLTEMDIDLNFATKEPSTWTIDDLNTYKLLCTNLKLNEFINADDIKKFIDTNFKGDASMDNTLKALEALSKQTQVSPVDNKTVIPADGTNSKIKAYAKSLYYKMFGSSEIKKSYITWANAKKAAGAIAVVYPFFVFAGIVTMIILLSYGIGLPTAVQTTSESLSGCYMFVGSNDAVKLEGCSTWYGQSVDNQLLCKCGAKANSSTPPDCNTLTGECGAPYCIGRSCKPATEGDTACSYQKTPILQCSGTSSTDPNYIYYAYRQYPPSSLVAGAITTSPVINNYSSTTTSNINKIIMYIFIVIVILIVLFFGGKFILNKMNKGKGKGKIKNKK